MGFEGDIPWHTNFSVFSAQRKMRAREARNTVKWVIAPSILSYILIIYHVEITSLTICSVRKTQKENTQRFI